MVLNSYSGQSRVPGGWESAGQNRHGVGGAGPPRNKGLATRYFGKLSTGTSTIQCRFGFKICVDDQRWMGSVRESRNFRFWRREI